MVDSKKGVKKQSVKEPIFVSGQFLAIYEDTEEDNFGIVVLLEDVLEDQKEVKALFFERVKNNLFKYESEDSLKSSHIIQTISAEDITIVYEKKASKTRGKKKEEEKDEKQKIQTVEVNAKCYKGLKTQVKKFKPPEPSSASEPEPSSSEDETESVKLSKNKKQSQKVSEPLKIKRPSPGQTSVSKSVSPEKKLVAPKGKKQKRKSSADEEDEENASMSLNTSKLSVFSQNARRNLNKKPTEYKRGRWNPNITQIDHCAQLESESTVPNFDCSVRNTNREIIRAAKIGSKPLLEKLLKSEYKISRLTERWGVENETTAIKTLIDKKDFTLLTFLLEQMMAKMDSKHPIKYGSDNKVFLQQIDTGFNDKYAYGVATRKVNVSRGGRQGNNAFVEELGEVSKGLDDEHIKYFLCSMNTTSEQVQSLLAYFPHLEGQFISKIGEVLRAGNLPVAEFLMKRGIKNDGYGLGEFFLSGLTGKTQEAVKEIKQMNVTKKAFAIENLTPLHCACINPKSDVLKHMLQVKPEFQNTDVSLRKLVHYAACSTSVEALKALSELSVDTRDTDNTKTSPLMYACRYGRVENVKFLLQENRSIINLKNKLGYTALHYAAENGHAEIVKLLLAAAPEVKLSQGGPDRKTCLHLAAAKGDFEMVKFLIDNGAKVILKDKLKRTPLLLAAKNGNLKIASLLLQEGSPFDEPDSSGNTCLHYACAYGYPEMIDLLFKAGANPNANNSWNLSPTAVALLKSYFSCLRKMLDNPSTNVNCIDDQGRTLISNAIQVISPENFNHVCFLLKDKKADPNIPDAKGLTAFDYLCAQNIENLVQNEIKPEMNNEEISTLKANKKSLYKKYFKLFIDYKSDINHQDSNGLTPIFRTLEKSNIDGALILLEEKELNLNIVSKKSNETIYHYLENLVSHEDFLKIAQFLVMKCNSVELIDKYNNNGRTPLQVLVGRFVGLVNGIKSTIYSELETQLKLKKREEGYKETNEDKKKTGKMIAEGDNYDEEEDEDDMDSSEEKSGGAFKSYPAKKKWRGLKGGARTFFHKQPKHSNGHTNAANLQSINITQAEQDTLMAEAEKSANTRINNFFSFMELIKTMGSNVNLLIKNPKKSKQDENGEIIFDEDDEIDYDQYFRLLQKTLEDAVDKKFDLPAKDKPEKTVGYSLLHQACSTNNLKVIKFLIEKYKIPLNKKSVYGESEIMKFLESNSQSDESLATLEYLIQSGASIELPNLNSVTPMLLAMTLQKDRFVEVFLKYKANVNTQDSTGNYTLLQAIKNKDLKMIEALLKHKANPNLKDKAGRTSMHWAINLSNSDADASNEIENCLISSGADLNVVDNRGRTPLHYAFVKIGDPFNYSNIDPIETVSNIMSRDGVKNDIRDNWGNTPLNYAAQRGSAISALYLIKNKVDINNRNVDGNTPLNECLLNGHQNMAIFLIQKDANLDFPVKIISMEDKKKAFGEDSDSKKKFSEDDEDDNPGYPRKFGYAAGSNLFGTKKRAKRKAVAQVTDDEVEYESSESVLDEKENDLDQDDEEPVSVPQQNPFAFGAGLMRPGQRRFGMGGNQGYASSSANVDTEANPGLTFSKKEKECTTFSIAIRRNWQSLAFLMLEFKFNLSLAILDCFNFKKYNYVYTLLLKKAQSGVYKTTNSQGHNLTHLFAKHSNKITENLFDKILTKLEGSEVDFSSKDKAGRTSLHYACEAGCIKLIKILLLKGLDINATDDTGVTPLGYIAKNFFGKVVEFAQIGREYVLDLNKRFSDGPVDHTILTYIIAKDKNFDFFSKLHELGADINAGDCSGHTPIIYYIRQNKEDQVKNFVKTFKTVLMTVQDLEGKTLIHHVVRPREFGAYENVSLLEYLAKFADINKADKAGKPPLFYAQLQESGIMEKALLRLGAKEHEMGQSVVRTTTSMLDSMEFPHSNHNYDDEFERFVEECKRNERKEKIEEKCQVDPNATGNYEVCYENDEPFDAYMVKVDINYGYYSGNVFYKMQLLREKVRDVYVLFTRYGRVGTSGQFQHTPFAQPADAKKEFCSVFKSKTGNLWEERKAFVKHDKKYRLLPTVKKTKVENFIRAVNYKDSRIPESKLEKSIFKLVRRICNYKVISNAINVNYRIDPDALPLQNLTKERLMDADAILKSLKKTLEAYEAARSKKDLAEITNYAEEMTKLSSEFYELIPTTNFKDQAIQPIMSTYDLSEKRKMLNDLMYFEVAIKLLGAAMYNIKSINPVDYMFNSLSFKIIRLMGNTEEYNILKEFINVGRQGQKEANLIANIYAVERKNEIKNIDQWKKVGNRMLLWHGTRGENLIGILQTGFRIAPADARKTGSMFGEGVYFADIFNKSYQYSTTTNNQMYHRSLGKSAKLSKRYLFLCEVALGKSKKLLSSEQVTGLPNSEFQSVMGYGRIGPDPKNKVFLPNGCAIPLGQIKDNPPLNPKDSFSLQHNEFIVYDTTQIRIRYIIECRDIDNEDFY